MTKKYTYLGTLNNTTAAFTGNSKNNKYLRADKTWQPLDVNYKYLDALGNWSKPIDYPETRFDIDFTTRQNKPIGFTSGQTIKGDVKISLWDKDNKTYSGIKLRVTPGTLSTYSIDLLGTSSNTVTWTYTPTNSNLTSEYFSLRLESYITALGTRLWTIGCSNNNQPNIENLSWATLKTYSANAKANPANYQNYLGATKTITITSKAASGVISGVTGGSYRVFIVDVNSTDGFVFMFWETPYRASYMPISNNTNSGGFGASTLYSQMNNTSYPIYSSLPTDLKNVMKTHTFKCKPSYSATSVNTYTNKLWLLSIGEINGSMTPDYVIEGERYAYFDKYRHDNQKFIFDSMSAIKPVTYLLRSCHRTTNCYYSGGAGMGEAYNVFPAGSTCAVSPCFTI